MHNHDFTLLRNVLVATAVVATPAACLSGSGGDGKDTGASQGAGSGQQGGGGGSGGGGSAGGNGGSGVGPITYGWMQAEFAETADAQDCECSWQFTGPVAGDLEWSVELRVVDVSCDRSIEFSDRQHTLAVRSGAVYLDQYFVGYANYMAGGYIYFSTYDYYDNDGYFYVDSFYDQVYYYGYFYY